VGLFKSLKKKLKKLGKKVRKGIKKLGKALKPIAKAAVGLVPVVGGLASKAWSTADAIRAAKKARKRSKKLAKLADQESLEREPLVEEVQSDREAATRNWSTERVHSLVGAGVSSAPPWSAALSDFGPQPSSGGLGIPPIYLAAGLALILLIR
jgi:mRNA-degrading endonuclease RelE of RelBE toxin-antitoxin system